MKNLQNFGVQELKIKEIHEVNGGGLESLFRRIAPIGIALYVMDNWSDIKSGIVDGWNDAA